VGVGEEAAVEHQVDVEGQPVLVAERHDVDPDGRGVVVAEELVDAVPELVHVEAAGVDDDIGVLLQGLEQRALPLDGLGHGLPVGGQRVAAAGGLVAADEHVGGGIEEEDLDPAGDALEVVEDRERVARALGAGADDEADLVVGRARRRRQLTQLRDERRGDVVDHEPAEVLQVGRGLAAAGSREPADDDEVGTHRRSSFVGPAMSSLASLGHRTLLMIRSLRSLTDGPW
jgi:hypothetical protein